MQAFSYLQRNSSYKDNLETITIFVLLLIYESLTSVYTYLSPLFGFSFILWIRLYDKKLNLEKILLFFYIIYYEIDKDFFILSFIPIFLFVRIISVNFLKQTIECHICRVIIYITSIYIGYYILNLFLAYIFNSFIPYLGKEYIFYILFDVFLIKIFSK